MTLSSSVGSCLHVDIPKRRFYHLPSPRASLTSAKLTTATTSQETNTERAHSVMSRLITASSQHGMIYTVVHVWLSARNHTKFESQSYSMIIVCCEKSATRTMFGFVMHELPSLSEKSKMTYTPSFPVLPEPESFYNNHENRL